MARAWTHADLTMAPAAAVSAAFENAPPGPAAADIAAPARGLFDNVARVNDLFAALPVYTRYLFDNLNINEGLAAGEIVGLAGLMRPFMLVQAYCLHQGMLDEDAQLAAFVFQNLAPRRAGVQVDIDALSLATGRAICTGLIRNSQNSLNMIAPRAAASWVGVDPAADAGPGAPGRSCPNLPQRDRLNQLPAPDYSCSTHGHEWTPDQIRTFMNWIARHVVPTWRETISGCYAAMYIAIAKRGELTAAKINAIARELRSACNLQLPTGTSLYRLIYRVVGDSITGNNANATFQRWLGDLPQSALRIRLTLQQASNSGLTQLSTIVRALASHPNFYWVKLAQVFPTEMQRATAALHQVNNNPFFGFNQDLGAIRSTQYPNVAWVCKELLIRVSGEGTLRTYAGWVRTPANLEVLERMFAAYQAHQTAQFDVPPGAAEQQAARDLISMAARNANLAA